MRNMPEKQIKRKNKDITGNHGYNSMTLRKISLDVGLTMSNHEINIY